MKAATIRANSTHIKFEITTTDTCNNIIIAVIGTR
jgi:hypothetical protein